MIDNKLIKNLIRKYEDIKNSGRLRYYTEEQTKKDFILPLFEILGWNVYSRDEVSAEESISSDRVDYGFYLNGRIKFYLEAKKFNANIHDEKFANQAIKYSFNKGATWAILTNFETLIVFNAQDVEGKLHDKRFFELNCSDYLDRIDQLNLLSKDSFQKNLLDREAEKVGKKIQKISVSNLLYKDLQNCRDILINELSQWNGNVDPDLLDEGVQKLLDRLIFIRVAEDRGIEPSTLIPMIREWLARKDNSKHIYQSMVDKFREFDDFYNSNLFSPHPFENWEEYSGATSRVINILYGKEGYYEYDFKAMPADVLGAVYENYLSHRLLKSKRGTTISKDAGLRKEQGIYYTPNYIVDYIVKNALNPVLDRCKSIEDLKKVKVLDPACGSGSFLIKAFELIFKKYEDFGFRSSGQEDLLKIQILQNNIYGVDLDSQAVEITRLNLLINALTKRERLPFLDNIRNGNSLISGTDEDLKRQFGKDFRDKKSFNWKEQFPEVFEQGGFDVIIGNPPYIKEFVNKGAFDGLRDNLYYQGKMDIWTLFGCIAIDLLKKEGRFSFIAPNNWIANAGASIFRNKILREGELKSFVDFGDYKVFNQAGIQTMIFIFEKKKPNHKYRVDYLKIKNKDIDIDELINKIFTEKIKIDIIPEKLIDKNITFETSDVGLILGKIEKKKNFELLEKEVGQGIVAAPDKYFLEKNIKKYNENEVDFLKKFYTASGRYKSGKSESYIFYICDRNFKDKNIEDYPNIKEHFKPFEKILKIAKIKYGTPNKPYFCLHREREERFFQNGSKIVCGVRVMQPSFYYTEKPYYGSRALNFIKTDRINLKYLTGILNSNLTFFWLKNKGKQLGGLLQIDKGPLLEIPVYLSGKKEQANIIASVDKMLELNEKLQETTENSDKWHLIKSEIKKTDKKIDEEVYRLYGLTDEDIKIIESSI